MKKIINDIDDDKELIMLGDKCDKYDYFLSVGCGIIGGIIDIFFVGAPGSNSIISNWTDGQVDKLVIKFAKMVGWTPRDGKENNIASAIGFLEKNYKVNYDQRYSTDVDEMFNMSTKNHHMMSLAHSPDIVGLFFSILNQFTFTSSFIANGKLITVSTEKYELKGTNFFSKIFCGFVNWIGHIMSDVAGSSGSRGNNGRGTGIVMPFYELFGLCKFGNFNAGKYKQDLAIIAIRAFEEGYDFRFGVATAIPVVITDLTIRLIWSLRQRFQYRKDLNECIPTKKHDTLRVMLIFGNATLCTLDVIDAMIQSRGNFLVGFMRINLIAWFRLIMLVMKEMCIRLHISDSMQECLESYKRINEALLEYLRELEKIDIEKFKKETNEYNTIITMFEKATTNEELNSMLIKLFQDMNYNKPWKGDFDKHMSNRNGTLIFE